MSNFPKLTQLSTKYGCPMGRHDYGCLSTASNVSLRKLDMVDSAYDKGGAYWGSGLTIYRAAWFNEDGESCEHFVRAGSRRSAAELLELKSDQLLRPLN